ncbi:MAG: hypothetical protein KY457_04240 [Actinobacteria bacterium]|nr:hypothetical protein [Actinomycetota bacterium]
MADRYVSPFDDRAREPVPDAPRPASLAGVTVGLLDISKPRGQEFLDRVEQHLRADHDVADVVRLRKPTFARPAPADVLAEAERCGAVLVALAD